MNEQSLKSILDGDSQAARFICDNFLDVQMIVNKTHSQEQ